MRWWLKWFVHNTCAHPVLPFGDLAHHLRPGNRFSAFVDRLHDRTFEANPPWEKPPPTSAAAETPSE